MTFSESNEGDPNKENTNDMLGSKPIPGFNKPPVPPVPPIPPMPPLEPAESAEEATNEEVSNEQGNEVARQNLLDTLDKFAKKRWDTDVATNTLKRLVDRRKEVIGQLWEAVENREADVAIRAEKFIEQFKNNMDARRRLDAVVRLMGRGSPLDPRTSKWFIDAILELAELTKIYFDSLSKK